MQVSPKTGRSRTRQFFVSPEHCHLIDGISLLSTSHLVFEMEQTALDVLQDFLEDDEVSLGIQLNVEMRVPGMEGDEVTCTATVVHREGPLVTFQVTADVNGDCLAQGLHIRRVLGRTNLHARVERRRFAATASQ